MVGGKRPKPLDSAPPLPLSIFVKTEVHLVLLWETSTFSADKTPTLPSLLSRIAIFLDAVHEQTGVEPQHQEYLFEGHLCVLEPSLSAQHIAPTSAINPLTLFSKASENPMGLVFRDRE